MNAKTGARIVTEKREGKAAGGLAAGHNFVVCGAPHAVRWALRILAFAIAEHTRLFEKLAAGEAPEHEVDVEGVRFVFTGTDKDRTTAQEYLSTLELDESELLNAHRPQPTSQQQLMQQAQPHPKPALQPQPSQSHSTQASAQQPQQQLAASLGAGLSKVAAAQQAQQHQQPLIQQMSTANNEQHSQQRVNVAQGNGMFDHSHRSQSRPSGLDVSALPHASSDSLFATTSPSSGAPRQPRPDEVERGSTAESAGSEYTPWSTHVPWEPWIAHNGTRAL